MRVGLFDSGIGGLTVLKEFIKYHPNNEYYYYGDTLNVPYGDKTIDELYECVTKIINYMLDKKVDIIVIACGTVSANLYERLKNELSIPVYSVISELPKYIEEKKYKKTLVLATTASINSHIYKNKLKNEVIEVACPKLVPIIESGDYKALDAALDEYLIEKDNIDSIVLGCTHYPIIKEYIKDKVPSNVDIIDIGELLAKKIELVDSYKSLDFYFSKKTKITEEYVNKLLNNVSS